MMTQKELNELEEEMRNENYQNEVYEAEMSRDYESFLGQLDAEIETVIEGIQDIVKQHTAYGWEMDERGVLELLKDYV